MRGCSTASKLALWIGYGAAVFAYGRTPVGVTVMAAPLLVFILRLTGAERRELTKVYLKGVLFFSLLLLASVLLVGAAGHWPQTPDAVMTLSANALVVVARITMVLTALCLILITSSATAFYRELRAHGVSPEVRATLLPAALFPKTLATKLSAIGEAQLARGINPREGFIQRPRILLSTLTLLMLGTLSNIPDRAAILSVRGVYLRDAGARVRTPMPGRDRLAMATGVALLVFAILVWSGVL